MLAIVRYFFVHKKLLKTTEFICLCSKAFCTVMLTFWYVHSENFMRTLGRYIVYLRACFFVEASKRPSRLIHKSCADIRPPFFDLSFRHRWSPLILIHKSCAGIRPPFFDLSFRRRWSPPILSVVFFVLSFRFYGRRWNPPIFSTVTHDFFDRLCGIFRFNGTIGAILLRCNRMTAVILHIPIQMFRWFSCFCLEFLNQHETTGWRAQQVPSVLDEYNLSFLADDAGGTLRSVFTFLPVVDSITCLEILSGEPNIVLQSSFDLLTGLRLDEFLSSRMKGCHMSGIYGWLLTTLQCWHLSRQDIWQVRVDAKDKLVGAETSPHLKGVLSHHCPF